MEYTYTVRGVDGKEYGPVSLGELNGWIREGRVQIDQEVRRSDTQQWSPARNLPELSASFPSAGTPPPVIAGTPTMGAAGSGAADNAGAAAQCRSGATWFYWIAGLSLINSIVAFSGSNWRFMLGLGITQVLDGVGTGMGSSGKVVVLVLDLLVAATFILFGVFAHKRYTWAFVVGMILFALDGLIFLLVQDWLGVAFHVFVLYCLFRGFKGCRAMRGQGAT